MGFSINQIVDALREEINGENRREVINELEEDLARKIKELSVYKDFFNLPLNNILSCISKVEFDFLEDDMFETLKNIISNTISAHSAEKETILLLQYIRFEPCLLDYDKISTILGLFNNCPLLVHLWDLYYEQTYELPIVNYDYEIMRLSKKIEKRTKKNH